MLGEATKAQKYIYKIRREMLDINMESPSTEPKSIKVLISIY